MVEIERAPTTRDSYNNDQFDWANATLTAVDTPVSMQPGAQSVTGSGEFRETVTTGYRLFTQPGVDLDLLETDRIRWAGNSYEVMEISRWPHPMKIGAVHHVEVQLQRVTG